MTTKKQKGYDFVTKDPKTNLMAEVKIVRYCPPDIVYESPIPNDVAARTAELKLLKKIVRYLTKL